MSDTTELLTSEDKPSPLRVRIPANPHGHQPSRSKSLPHQTDNASHRERTRVRYTLSATALSLLLILSLFYWRAGSRAAYLPSPAISTTSAFHSPQASTSKAREAEAMNFASSKAAGHSVPDSLQIYPEFQSVTSANSTKAVVVAQHREDVAWLQQLPSGIQRIIYQAENDTAERPVRVNQGETAVYLQYIVEEYNNLPDHAAFVHAHQVAKHMPDKLDILQKLRWDALPYANLRYVNITFDLWGKWTGDWLCPQNPVGPAPSEEIIWDELRVNQSQLFADVWQELFAKSLGPLPEYVHSPCCAEFVVSKERIQSRPLRFYEDCLSWVEEASADRYWAGRIFEYMWHIIFGEPAMYYAPTKCELLVC